MNEEQLAIMKCVRDRLEKKPNYICHEIEFVCRDEGYLYWQGGGHELVEAIEEGIGHCYTMEEFLNATCTTMWQLEEDGNRVRHDALMWMARAAWVDKIIETGEITPQYRRNLEDV